MEKGKKNTQSRKYQITINNPEEKGLTHEVIKTRLISLKSLIYFCMSDEIGGETKTYHTHIFVVFENPKLFSTMINLFDNQSHLENARGTGVQNRDYVFKQGKWENSEKATTVVPGTQEEWGELPAERQSSKPELAILYDLIKEGLSNFEIIDQYPEYMFDITHIDRCRLILKQEQYKNTWRNLEVFYVFGRTGLGKSKNIYDAHGYEGVYRITNYNSHPFDTYQCQDVIAFEEFNSSLKIQDMLNLLDGYPITLACRYSDRQGIFTKVYITSNISLEKQYPQVKEENLATWQAFIRRINKVVWYKSEDIIIHYDSTEEYFNRDPLSGYPIRKMNF